MLLEIVIWVILLFFFYFIWDNWRLRHGPPGPLRFPIIGTLPQVAMSDPVAHIGLDRMADKYGPVMSLKLGTVNTVILSSYEAIKDVCSKEESYGRQCEGLLFDRNLRQNIGIGYSNEQPWYDMRKYCRDTLRKYGFGNREAMQNNIYEELSTLFATLERDMARSPSSTVYFEHTYLHVNITNLIIRLVMPAKVTASPEEIVELLRHSHDFFESSLFSTGVVAAYPFLRHIAPDFLGHTAQMKGLRGIEQFARRLLEIRRHNGMYAIDPECFVDDFLQKIDEDLFKPTPFFTDDQFVVVFTDLLQGSSDTTANTLGFTLLHLTCSQRVQEKLYQEIMSVCGTDRLPNLGDRAEMTYAQAVILEGFRWARIAVLGVPKKLLGDLNYKGYEMKKGTVILQNLHSVLFNEMYWGDPNTFRPERFLDESGKIITKHAERVIIFGTGKRNCFGEVLAKDASFLFLTSLIQKFSLTLPPNQPPPSLEPVVALTLHPVDFDVIFQARSQ